MTARDLDTININTTFSTEHDEEFSIPLDISDIINICREFNKLGWQIQNQIEQILEIGVEESIKSGHVKRESLPHIKAFLHCISQNPYFGDSRFQSIELIKLIKQYENEHKEINSPFN